MTDLAVRTTPRVHTSTARHPGIVVGGRVSRLGSRSGAAWGLIFAVYVTAQTFGYTSAYKTQASRDQFAKAFGTNIGINALIGPARSINTVAGYASWRLLGILSVLGAIWGLLISTRLLRGDEEEGRYDLLLAGQTTRRRGTGQGMLGLGVALAVLFVLTTLGTVLTGRASSVGFGFGASVFLSLTLVSGAAVFLAIGALTSQLAATRRRAASMAGVIFGVAYALRMVADSDPGLHWMVWLSPLGWIEESRPLVHPHPMALLPVAVLIVAVSALALQLAGARDLGSATFPGRDTAQPHLALVGGPTAVAARLMRPVALGWIFAVAAMSVLIGSVAEASTKDIAGNRTIEQTLGRLGGHGSLVADYLGLTFLVVALMISLVAAGQTVAIRGEEAEGRLEALVVRPLSRTSWLAGRLVLSAGLLVIAGLVAGLGTWAGAASQHSGIGFGSLLSAGLNIVPPSLLLLGLGALALGMSPRLTSVIVYGYLAWSFLIELIGAVVRTSHWLLDTSVYFHMAPAPAASPNWATAGVITGLGVAGAAIGSALLNHRDVLVG